MAFFKKTSNKKTFVLIYVLSLLFSVCLLTTFSFDATSKEELLNNAIFDYSESSTRNDFSYSIEIDKFDEELARTANRHNRIFYNNRNVVSIMENTNYSLYGNGVVFSNSSKLDTADGFTTNHLLFSSYGGAKIADLDFFENVGNEDIGDSTFTKISIIIPYSLSLKIADDEMCSFDKLLHADVTGYFGSDKYKYYVAGIWDDQITSMSYYNYNSFYEEFDEYVVFVNSKYTFSKNSNSSAYLLIGKDREKNLDFLHACKNSNGNSLEFSVPKLKINNFYVNDMLMYDYFNYLLENYHSFRTIFICVISGIFAVASLITMLLLLIKQKTHLFSSIFFLQTRPFIPIVSAILASLFVACVSKIRLNTLPIVSISSVGVLLLCMANLILTAVFYFMFNKLEKQKKYTSVVRSFNKVGIISFCDLRVANASTIRIQNIIKMLDNAGIQWIHIGYSESNNSTDKNIGINRYSNKLLNFILAPFLFIQFLSKIKNHIDALYIYSPLPIFSSIFVNCFANCHNLEVIHDVCEFQNISEVNFKKPGWFYISNVFYNRFIISLGDKVIPITTYLDKYFESKGVKTFLIPPVFDESSIDEIIKKEHKEIVFTYIGFPGKKDNLKMCINGFRLYLLDHKESIQNIKINFYGPLGKYKDYVNDFNEQEIKQCFHFFGKCSRDQLVRIYEETSFVFFMRNPKKRFSKAGFPSKVVEALFYSTAILTNKTSDLSLYLQEPNNVVWVDDYSAESFSRSLEHIFGNYKSIVASNNCREIAGSHFSINNYSKGFIEFLSLKEVKTVETMDKDDCYFEVDI